MVKRQKKIYKRDKREKILRDSPEETETTRQIS